MISLRPYQEEALSAIEAAYARGVTRPLLVLATGGGKTVVFAHLIHRRPGRALVLAHRKELIDQACTKIRMVVPEIDLGVVKASQDERDHACVVASVPTLAQDRRLSRFEHDAFQTIVVDECHHACPGSSYEKILSYFGAFVEQAPPLSLGVTATPYRTGKRSLGDIWQEIVYRKELPELIAEGYLSPIKALHLKLDQLDLRKVKKAGGDFADEALGQAISAANGPLLVSQAWAEHAQDRQTLLFTPTIELAGEMAAAFQNAGIPAESLSYLTPSAERPRILSRYDSGETRVIANPAVLTEGFDSPPTSCVAICRPTRSKNLFVQMLGRGTRLYPGKEEMLLMDLSGCSKVHDLVTLETLYKSEDVAPAVEEDDEDETEEENGGPPLTQPHYLTGRLLVEEVNIFSRRGESLHWIKVFDKPKPLWVLPLGKGWVCLGKSSQDPQEDRWSAFTLSEKGEQIFLDAPYSLPMGYAQGIGEDLARKLGAGGLSNPNARWRKAPASEKQMMMVNRLGREIFWTCDELLKTDFDKMNAGQAADIITRIKITRAIKLASAKRKAVSGGER